MIGNEDVQRLMSGGGNVVAEDGSKIGSIGQVYLDDQSGRPEWVTTKTGLFGTAENFVPLADARIEGNDVRVPYSKDKVKDAPKVDADGHLDQSQEREIYAYYGVHDTGVHDTGVHDTGVDHGVQGTTGTTGTTGTHDEVGTVGHDTSGPTTDQAMTRSEERLDVGTQQHEAGRARLRKWVETENVTTTVPVTKERAVVDREPITDGNVDNALDGPAISEEEHEVVLNEERAVVDKTVEPVERVRLGKESVTEQQTVSDEVRKEQIEVEGDTTTR